MKFFTTLALAVAAVNAVALPEPNRMSPQELRRLGLFPLTPRPATDFCRRVGRPCHKAKRAAEALAEAIADETTEKLTARDAEAIPFCMSNGEACDIAKREAEELSTILARSSDDPNGFLSGLAIERRYAEPTDFCRPVGRPCHKKREAEPTDFCRRVGRPCHKKRSAEATDFCRRVGRPCHKTKRAAEAVLEIVKRSPEPEPEAEADPTDFCRRVGRPCHKKREAEAELERRCNEPGQPCHLAQRDLDAVELVAREIIGEEE